MRSISSSTLSPLWYPSSISSATMGARCPAPARSKKAGGGGRGGPGSSSRSSSHSAVLSMRCHSSCWTLADGTAVRREDRGVVAVDAGDRRGTGDAAPTSGSGSTSGRRDDSGTRAYDSTTGGGGTRSTDLRRRRRRFLTATPHTAPSIATTSRTPAPTPSDSISDARRTNALPPPPLSSPSD